MYIDGYPHIYIKDFLQQPFILNKPGQYITNIVNELFQENEMQPKAIYTTDNVSTAINLAACGLGFAFVPEFGIYSKFFPKKDLMLFVVGDPPVKKNFAAIYKKDKHLSKIEKIFISELQEFSLPNNTRETSALQGSPGLAETAARERRSI